MGIFLFFFHLIISPNYSFNVKIPFLEKAFAKLCGSFPKIEANKTPELSISDVYGMILGPIDFFVKEIPQKDIENAVYNDFLEKYKQGSVISFTSRRQGKDGDINTGTGLVNYHGYGLLDICENVLKTGFTLIKCHNPWSAGGEWNGDWSDSSDLWNKYPKIKKELNFSNVDDGTFWIEKKDFSRAFCLFWGAAKKSVNEE